VIESDLVAQMNLLQRLPLNSTTPSVGDDGGASMPSLVLLPALDGTGKLFAELLKALNP
jgi:hypothetical protein